MEFALQGLRDVLVGVCVHICVHICASMNITLYFMFDLLG